LLADDSIKHALGRTNDVTIELHMTFVPIDFIVMDMRSNTSSPIILGRPFVIRLFGKLDAYGDIYSAPVTSKVVGLVVSDIGTTDVGRDLIVDNHSSGLQRINEKHCRFMAMQYPLLFPYGEIGYHDDIMYHPTPQSRGTHHKKVTMLEYYAYRLHDRPGDFNTLLRGKKLTQWMIIAVLKNPVLQSTAIPVFRKVQIITLQ
jgi:hypothetical protein